MIFTVRKLRFILPALLVLFSAPALAKDSVAPTSRVTAAVVVREEPTTQSDPLARLRPGETLPFEGDVPDWYRVEFPDGSYDGNSLVAARPVSLHLGS